MQIHMNDSDVSATYKLLTSLIVPRPIAWVLTKGDSGRLNLAPFSFFNCVGTDPALIVLNVGDHPDRPKDTAVNIQSHPFFVVNLVDHAHGEAMSDSATDFPSSISEVEHLGLGTTPSVLVDVPRLKETPAALECRLHSVQRIGNNRLVFGEVLSVYVSDEMFSGGYVDSAKLDLIGRMGGGGGYTRTRDTFEIRRKRYRE